MTATTATTTTVRAEGLVRRFGSRTAVDGVDLAVAAGEIVALIGANGAGKTTLVRMVLGLLRPDRGRVDLFGRPPDRRTRSRLGYVPQHLGLYAELTVAENLRFRSAVLGGTAPPPEGTADTRVGSLPLGQQRRVAFAAATGHGPELLVLDEPTSGVSPLERSRLWALIGDQTDRGAGVLVSTHHLDEAEQADRVVLLAGGRVVATGPAEAIRAGRTTVEVDGDDWAAAFALLDRERWPLILAGRRIRLPGAPRDEVDRVIRAGGITATVRSVPASLDEVILVSGPGVAAPAR